MRSFYLIIATLLLLLAQNAAAESGIYLSATDYKDHKLTYAGDCNSHKASNIKVDNFWGEQSVVTVKYSDKKLYLKKAELFGYRDCSGNTYRFFSGQEYQMAEAGGKVIYQHIENIPQAKGFKRTAHFYFSADPGSEIKPLDLERADHETIKLIHTIWP